MMPLKEPEHCVTEECQGGLVGQTHSLLSLE